MFEAGLGFGSDGFSSRRSTAGDILRSLSVLVLIDFCRRRKREEEQKRHPFTTRARSRLTVSIAPPFRHFFARLSRRITTSTLRAKEA